MALVGRQPTRRRALGPGRGRRDDGMDTPPLRGVRRRIGRRWPPNDDALRIASEVNRERYDVPTHDLKASHSVDHTFVMAFEWVQGYELIHSEVVSLGALINAYVYQWGFDETKALLDACRVRYRPADIGCTWDEVKAVLANLNELNDRLGHAQNWFHLHSLSDESFQQMAAAIDAR